MFSKLSKIFEEAKNLWHFHKFQSIFKLNPELSLNKDKLEEMFKIYEEWIKHDRNHYHLSYEELALMFTFIRAFKSDFHDSYYISKLLIYLHDRTSTHFIIFYNSEIFQMIISSMEYASFAEFFLRHANRHRLLLNRKRIADLTDHSTYYLHPVEIILLLGSPELLLVFLRYGALTSGIDGGSNISIQKIIEYLVRTIIKINTLKFRNDNGGWRNKKFDSIIACGKIIMRVCPQLKKDMLIMKKDSESLGDSSAEDSFTEDSFLEVSETSCKWVSHNILPELQFRIFQPMPLKHTCRLRIREILHDKWLLPGGIEKLPLPQYLKNYLDLFCD